MWGVDYEPKEDLGDDIWAEHLDAFNAFLLVDNQWRHRPDSGKPTGLDYTAVDAGLRLAGVSLSPDQWSQFRTIEGAARAAIAETFQ